MKNFLKTILVAVMAVTLCAGLAGCSGTANGPDGTYTVGDKFTYMEFDGDRVTLQLGPQMQAEGTWELDGDKLTLIYDNNAGTKEYTYDSEADTITASNGDVLSKIEE
jgi:hypothetical protein